MSENDSHVRASANDTASYDAVEPARWIDQPDAFAAESTIQVDPAPTGDRGQVCLIVVQGNELARRYRLKNPITTIGRNTDADVQLAAGGVSRLHAELRRIQDAYFITDLDSTNGVYVNDRRVTYQRVENGDRIRLGDTTLRFLVSEKLDADYYDEIYRLTTTDEATGTYNRRYFFQTLEREVARATRHQRPLTMLMVDVDTFSTINNQWGYLVGDSLLVQLASRIRCSCRVEDVFARFGGEEFCLMLPETDTDGALVLAERLRRLVETRPFVHDEDTIPMTISIGIASIAEVDAPGGTHSRLADANKRLDQLILIANQKLERAKKQGGNTIIP